MQQIKRQDISNIHFMDVTINTLSYSYCQLKPRQGDFQFQRDSKGKVNSVFEDLLCAKHCALAHLLSLCGFILFDVKFYLFLLKHEKGSIRRKKEHWTRSQIWGPAEFYLSDHLNFRVSVSSSINCYSEICRPVLPGCVRSH